MFLHMVFLPIFLTLIQSEVSGVNTDGVSLTCAFNNNFPLDVDLNSLAIHCDRVSFLRVVLSPHNAKFVSSIGTYAFSFKYGHMYIHGYAKTNIEKLKSMNKDRKVLLQVAMDTSKSSIQVDEYKENLKQLLLMARDLQYDGIFLLYDEAMVATNFLSILYELDYTSFWPGMELDVLVRNVIKPDSILWGTYDKMITKYIFGFANATTDIIEPLCPFNIKHPRDMKKTIPEYKSLNMSKAIVMINPGMKSHYLKKDKIKRALFTDLKNTCYLLNKSKKVSWDLTRSVSAEAYSKDEKYVLYLEDLQSLTIKFNYAVENGIEGFGVYVQFSKQTVKVPQCDQIYEKLLRGLKYYVDKNEEMLEKVQLEMNDLLYNTKETSSKKMSKVIDNMGTTWF